MFSASEGSSPTLTKLPAEKFKLLLFAGSTFKDTDARKLGDVLDWNMARTRLMMEAQFRGKGLRAWTDVFSAIHTV